MSPEDTVENAMENTRQDTKLAPPAREPTGRPASSSPDWRIWLGLSLTTVWLLLLSIYVASSIGWRNIGSAPIETLGNFLEGAFAPLAFLWLVIGYFLQKKELVQNTDAITMQFAAIQKSADQSVIQSEAIRASEQHARRESFLRIAENVKQQLGNRMGLLFISSQGSTATGVVSGEKISQMWNALNKTDPESFSRSMLELQTMHGEYYAYKLLYGTPTRTRHSEDFIFNFARLLRAADACDEDGMIRDSLVGSAHGFIYNRMIAIRDKPPAGLQYGVYDFDPDTLDPP